MANALPARTYAVDATAGLLRYLTLGKPRDGAYVSPAGDVVSGWTELARFVGEATHALPLSTRDDIIDAVVDMIETSPLSLTSNARSMVVLRLRRIATDVAAAAAARRRAHPPRESIAGALHVAPTPTGSGAAGTHSAQRSRTHSAVRPALGGSEGSNDDVTRIRTLAAQEATLTAMMLDVIVSGGGVSVVAALVAARDRLRAAEGDVWSRIITQGAPVAALPAVHEAPDTVADTGSGTVAVPVAMPVPRRTVDSAVTASTVEGRGPVAVVSTAAAVDSESSSTTAISASAAFNTAVEYRVLPRVPQNRRTGLRAAAAAPARGDGDDADADGLPARPHRGCAASSYA